MAEAIVSLVLQTLGNMLKEEASFLSGVSDQVEEVRTELKRMLCFLKDADSRNCKDETIRNWLREIRSLAYRIEDLVEIFAIEVASRRSSGRRGIKKILKRVSGAFSEIRSLHHLGVEISKVKDDISSITTSLQRYDVRAIGEAENSGAANEDRHYQQWIRQTYAHEVEEYFVGMEDDIAKLVSLVIDDDKRHRVISVWGMGGLGKTTLTRKVYKHIDVQRCFERFAWACVTQEGQIQIKLILQDLLMQLLPEKKQDVKFMEHRELVQQLHQVQIEKKCLVVLDDIWKVDDWKSLLAAFPVVEGYIKVLLTTRNRNVAKIGCLYELKCLNGMEGWDLLQRIAFSRKRADFKIDRNIQDVGIEMVAKCGGLPLSISVLGGILKDKNSLTDWQMVNRYIGSYLSKREDNEERDGGSVARVLSLSYNELPYHLKLCFLYLGNFKEDENIQAQLLYLLWMAEGMVLTQHRRSGETLMEVAQRYLDELGQRSMVQLKVDESSMSRRFVSCRLHDMMRDLCLEKGREEEFVKVIDFQGSKQPSLNSYSDTNKAYRLVIHVENEEDGAASISTEQEDCQQLRSLFCLKAVAGFWEKEMFWPQGIVVKKFKFLRVLKFEGFDFDGKKLPIELSNLVHLRLLSLKFCKLDELPPSIADLPLLMTLDIQVKNEIKIPNVLWKMKRLKHLFLSYNHCTEEGSGKLRLYGLSELETLWALDSKMDEFADLSELENLRILYAKVNDDENLRVIIDHISKNCPNLREINLSIGDCCDFISSDEGLVLLEKLFLCTSIHRLYLDAQLNRFPSYDQQFLQSLVALRFSENYMEEDPMETLGKLPQLGSLTLGANSYMGEFLICHEFDFPQLRSLQLYRLPNLVYWKVEKGSMPNLSHLEISYCEVLHKVPHELRFAVGLKELVISGMPNKFCNRVKVVDGQEGKDFYKIQHVPSISVSARDDE